MVPNILRDRRFLELLQRFDQELAEQARSAGCQFCGGVLHMARYARKPRGLCKEFESVLFIRQSLCCAQDGCRRRTTPPSVLFMGRRHFLSVAHVLVGALERGPNARRRRQLQRMLGVDRRTLKRWRRWWADVFRRSPLWSATPILSVAATSAARFPRAFFTIFRGRGPARLLSILAFLAPTTTPTVHLDQAERWVHAARRVCPKLVW